MNKIDKFFTKDVEQFSKLYFNHLKETFDKIDVSEIKNFVDTLLSARERGATIFFMGNGGSAETASHFANDLSFGVNEYKKPFRVVSITDNASVLTALGNDYGYDDIFIRQLRVYGKKDDVVVGVSASGNSKNLVNAFKYSSSVGIKTVALIAFDGGKMNEISDQYLHIPTGDKEYGPAEDLHIIIDHLIANYLMRLLKL